MNWTQRDNYIGAIVGQISILVWMACALQPLSRRFGEVGLLIASNIAGTVYDICMYFVVASILDAWCR